MADKVSITTLALAKRFATGLAAGNYTNVRVDGTKVIFTLITGEQAVVRVPTPKDGVGVKRIEIIDGELVFTMTDNTKIITPLPDSVLTEDLVVSNPVGSATLGKKYLTGTALEVLIRDMLIKEEVPVVSMSITPNRILYDKVTEKLEQVTMKLVTTRKTYDIDNIKIYVDDVLVKTIDEDVAEGGTYNYIHTYTPFKNKNTTLRVVITDVKGLYSSTSTTIKFVGKTYYGYVESNVGEPTEAQVKALQNNILKDTKTFVYKNITFDYNKIVYAYPKDFGELSQIRDEVNSFTYYPGSFTKQLLTIDNIPYILYIQNTASQSVNNELTFK